MTIIDVEKEVDLARQALLSHPRFDMLAVWDMIDRYNLGFITSTDIGQFLSQSGVHANERELFELACLYERTPGGRI